MRPTNTLIRAKARSILEDWDIEDPSEIDLDEIAVEQGLIIVEKSIKGSVARLVTHGNRGLIIVRHDIREEGRKRFAAAHELGHFVLHRSKTPVRICADEEFLVWYSQSDTESESNEFAAELLMPEGMFKKRAASTVPSFSHIERLSENFRTTLTATSIRYVELSNNPCALVAAHDGIIKWFCVSESFQYRLISVGSKLHPWSCANDFFKDGKIPDRSESVSGEAWLENQKLGRSCFLCEEVRSLTSYRMTLSLLWVHQDNNKRDDWFRDYHRSTQPDPDHFTPDGKRYRW